MRSSCLSGTLREEADGAETFLAHFRHRILGDRCHGSSERKYAKNVLDLLIQHRPIQEHDGVEGLILSRLGHLPIDG